MHQLDMLEHIAVHSLQVCRVALLLADRLTTRGRSYNRGLLQAAALLHDITKTRSFVTGEDHARTGAGLLGERGFLEVAELVRQHVVLDSYRSGAAIDEAAIVNYADKRVLHDAVVSLDQRMQYIIERYGETPDRRRRIRKLWQMTAALEERIFSRLSIEPADLPVLLPAETIASDLQDYRRTAPVPGAQRPVSG